MALLSDGDLNDLHIAFEDEQFSKLRAQTSLSRADIRAAVDALDSFLESNASSINNAIPQPARGSLTAAQKARLLVFVVEKRYLSGA